jgi:hypothetical protein
MFLIFAFALGTERELLLAPAIGEEAAHLGGTLVFVGTMLVITAILVKRSRSHSSPMALWLIGVLCVAITVAFEFLFFHCVSGKPWDVLVADYNVLRGRIWVLVPLRELVGPPACGRSLGQPPEGRGLGRNAARKMNHEHDLDVAVRGSSVIRECG